VIILLLLSSVSSFLRITYGQSKISIFVSFQLKANRKNVMCFP
jgi:hypothetical protein